MYAYFRKLVYFSTECIFAPNAYRGHARVLLKDLEKIDPAIIMNIIHSGENMKCDEQAKLPIQTTCDRCKYVSSQPLCKACVLLEGLNRGLPRLGIGKSSRVKRLIAEDDARKEKSKCCGKGNCNNEIVENITRLNLGITNNETGSSDSKLNKLDF